MTTLQQSAPQCLVTHLQRQTHPQLNIRDSFLMNGDCIDILKNIPKQSVDFVLTDPPYLVGYRDRNGRAITGDRDGSWIYPAFKEVARVLKNDAFAISFYGYGKVHHFLKAWIALGLHPVGHFTFVKEYASGKGFTKRSHENAYLLAKGKPRLPGYAPKDVIAMPYSGNTLHPTQKPLEALRPLIAAYTRPQDVVLDPFAGSASTALAAKQLDRRYIAIEKDAGYFGAAKTRLLNAYRWNVTPKKATLATRAQS